MPSLEEKRLRGNLVQRQVPGSAPWAPLAPSCDGGAQAGQEGALLSCEGGQKLEQAVQ